MEEVLFVFFIPFASAIKCLSQVVLRDQTDYYGYVAWGEYPHCFAAVLNQAGNHSKLKRLICSFFLQEECYRLILAKGGNHDLQDINGCTVTHILTIYNNMRVTQHRHLS